MRRCASLPQRGETRGSNGGRGMRRCRPTKRRLGLVVRLCHWVKRRSPLGMRLCRSTKRRSGLPMRLCRSTKRRSRLGMRLCGPTKRRSRLGMRLRGPTKRRSRLAMRLCRSTQRHRWTTKPHPQTPSPLCRTRSPHPDVIGRKSVVATDEGWDLLAAVTRRRAASPRRDAATERRLPPRRERPRLPAPCSATVRGAPGAGSTSSVACRTRRSARSCPAEESCGTGSWSSSRRSSCSGSRTRRGRRPSSRLHARGRTRRGAATTRRGPSKARSTERPERPSTSREE
jgi:hypothetical protein